MKPLDSIPSGYNTLAAELYALLDREGGDGVREKIMQIKNRPGVDQVSLHDTTALRSAIDHFRTEARADPLGKAATILEIIERCELTTVVDRISADEKIRAQTARASRRVIGEAWRRGGGFWNTDEYGEVRQSRDDLIGLEEY